MPDFSRERAALQAIGGTLAAGIDEAGRGPWAGPVVAAAAVLDEPSLPPELRYGLNDSKKLSAKKREYLFDILSGCKAAVFGIGQAEVREIDALNILNATYKAMTRALEDAMGNLGRPVDVALVDGNRAPPLPCKVQTLVKGDSLSLSVAAASIVAKVTRDRLMAGLALQYPGYGWETNMGYGTAEHQDAIVRLGLTPHHRRSFAPVRAVLRAQLDGARIQNDLN